LRKLTTRPTLLTGFALVSRHAAPDVSRFDYLVEAAAGRGVRLDPSSSKALAQSLDAATVCGARTHTVRYCGHR